MTKCTGQAKWILDCRWGGVRWGGVTIIIFVVFIFVVVDGLFSRLCLSPYRFGDVNFHPKSWRVRKERNG
jgi:hypothetical protein